MQTPRLLLAIAAAALLLGACSAASLPRLAGGTIAKASLGPQLVSVRPSNEPVGITGMISRYAEINGVPAALIHRVVQRESGYNPRARNGPYWGLMQIRHDTAMSMGYRGPASGLLDPDTNLKYGVKYLAGAYLVGNRNSDQAMRNYARGYYYDARRKGLLDEAGLR